MVVASKAKEGALSAWSFMKNKFQEINKPQVQQIRMEEQIQVNKSTEDNFEKVEQKDVVVQSKSQNDGDLMYFN